MRSSKLNTVLIVIFLLVLIPISCPKYISSNGHATQRHFIWENWPGKNQYFFIDFKEMFIVIATILFYPILFLWIKFSNRNQFKVVESGTINNTIEYKIEKRHVSPEGYYFYMLSSFEVLPSGEFRLVKDLLGKFNTIDETHAFIENFKKNKIL